MYNSLVSFEDAGLLLDSPQNFKRPLKSSLFKMSAEGFRGFHAQNKKSTTYRQLDDHRVDPSLEGDALRDQMLPVVRELVPHWRTIEASEFQIRQCAGGLTNKLYRVSVQVGEENQRVLVRVYGEATEGIIDRESEILIWRTLHRAKLGPRFYGTYSNGCVYGYVEGRPLNTFDLQESKIMKLVAEHIAQLHTTVKVPGFDRQPMLWNAMKQWIDLVPTDWDHVKDKDQLAAFEKLGLDINKEVADLKQHLDKLNSPTVFCHNDINPNNIIFHEKSGSVMLIDHEYASYNYRGYELGNHFVEFVGYELDWSQFPSKDKQLVFLRRYLSVYLTYKKDLEGEAKDDDNSDDDDSDTTRVIVAEDEISNEQLEALYKEANQYSLATHLFWGAWGLAQSKMSEIEFDYFGYALKRFQHYFDIKSKILAL